MQPGTSSLAIYACKWCCPVVLLLFCYCATLLSDDRNIITLLSQRRSCGPAHCDAFAGAHTSAGDVRQTLFSLTHFIMLSSSYIVVLFVFIIFVSSRHQRTLCSPKGSRSRRASPEPPAAVSSPPPAALPLASSVSHVPLQQQQHEPPSSPGLSASMPLLAPPATIGGYLVVSVVRQPFDSLLRRDLDTLPEAVALRNVRTLVSYLASEPPSLVQAQQMASNHLAVVPPVVVVVPRVASDGALSPRSTDTPLSPRASPTISVLDLSAAASASSVSSATPTPSATQESANNIAVSQALQPPPAPPISPASEASAASLPSELRDYIGPVASATVRSDAHLLPLHPPFIDPAILFDSRSPLRSL